MRMSDMGMKTVLLGLSLIVAGMLRAADEQPRTSLEVTSAPSGAIVWVDHLNRGVTPLTLTDLPPGPHLLQVMKEGYNPVFESVSLEPAVPKRVPFELVRQNGLLLIVTDPAGCDISENGVTLGTSPLLLTKLAVGAHRLVVASPGYQTKELDVVLEGRTPLRREVSLLSDSGTLQMTSDPSDAEVFVNGISRGRTPCKVDRIPGGQVTLEVKAEGFKPYTSTVTMAAGEVQSIDARLTPLPGTLRIVTIPDGARVYVNDEYKGRAPYDLLNAKPGEYRIRVDMPGHEPNARTVTIDKGASSTEEFRLVKNTGRIELVTAPSSAMVLIDGKKHGLTTTSKADTTAVSDPFSIEDVIEGEHELEIFRKGYTTQKKKVTVTRGETLTVQVKLVRQFIPDYEVTTTRAYYKGVLEYKNDEGIRLEIMPGVSQTIPMSDVKKHGPLKAQE
ncbi:MAG: PEGA domain-containing protein [Kiritimatiellae bacterium]|nr:PEGA domain-containing protein [Kiritimatiellia bacterium]